MERPGEEMKKSEKAKASPFFSLLSAEGVNWEERWGGSRGTGDGRSRSVGEGSGRNKATRREESAERVEESREEKSTNLDTKDPTSSYDTMDER